jgi:thymidylate synthase
MSTFRITGTLYSKEGVSIILRNLALNPYIKYLYVWAFNLLSKTSFGVMGKNMLEALWKSGINDDHSLCSTGELIHKEIKVETIRNIVKNVELINVSDFSLEEVIKKAKRHQTEKVSSYMKPLNFPEATRDTTKPFASEEVGWCVRGATLAKTWTKVVDRIIRYGSVKKTEYGNMQKELQAVTWVIENQPIDNLTLPEWPTEVLEHIGFNLESIKQYKKQFLDPVLPKDASYTYGQRLNAYLGNVNQIKQIIDHINTFSNTRRAIATTFYPPDDLFHSNPPCLSQVQIISTDDRINMLVTFRSHDILKAAIPNAIGLLSLQAYIADQTHKKVGKLAITSNSAHIYEEDWKMAQDLVTCAIWEGSALTFNEKEDLDQRGYIRISVRDNSIYTELVNPNGEQLFEYSGKTAREVGMKFAKLDLLAKPDHYCDISIELVKAELAMKKHLEYVQDRPLTIDGTTLK